MIVAGAVALLALALTLNWRLGQGFVDFINATDAERLPAIAEALAEFHAENDGWAALRDQPRRWRELLQRARDAEEQRADATARDDDHAQARERIRRHRHSELWAPLWSRLSVFDAERDRVLGRYGYEESERREAITVAGRTVGWVGLRGIREVRTRVGEAFLRDQRRGLILASIAMAMILGISAALLARTWTRPIERIGQVTRRLAGGDFAACADIVRGDEIGALARDIDFLARSLGEADTSRKRWMADTAHELRTPLAVLKGEIEALQDGIRPLNRDAIASLHAETVHLGALIEELRELALADVGALDYHMETVDLAELVRDCLEANTGRFGQHPMTVELSFPTAPFTLRGDSRRLRQLIENLLENSLRYTNPGGRLEIALTSDSEGIAMQLDDSEPGVSAELLPTLFEPFVRGDAARTRANGGSGLGLAICKRIVEAHGGTIVALSSPLGGLRIIVRWPPRQRSRAA